MRIPCAIEGISQMFCTTTLDDLVVIISRAASRALWTAGDLPGSRHPASGTGDVHAVA
jgi:hypothetical protein